MTVPITFLVTVYNEENRLPIVLSHAVLWADEVLVLDKSSTDKTLSIARTFHPRVKARVIPFSPQGQEANHEVINYPDNDWIFECTCSEIPTRRLVAEARSLLERDGDRLDLVFVPRRMYSFGVHDENSPWSISYYPFLYHRKRAIRTGVIHDHLRARSPANIATIPYANDCCIYHLTHPSAQRFVETHAGYARLEAEVERDRERAIVDCLKDISDQAPRIFRTGLNWPGIYSAWTIYKLMNVLFIWERSRGVNVPSYYRQLSNELLLQEWGVSVASTRLAAQTEESKPLGPTAGVPSEAEIQSDLRRIAFLAYTTANLIYYFQHPGRIPGALRQYLSRLRWRLKKSLRPGA